MTSDSAKQDVSASIQDSLRCAAAADVCALGTGDTEIAKGLDEAAAKHIVALRQAVCDLLPLAQAMDDEQSRLLVERAQALVRSPCT